MEYEKTDIRTKTSTIKGYYEYRVDPKVEVLEMPITPLKGLDGIPLLKGRLVPARQKVMNEDGEEDLVRILTNGFKPI